MIPRCPQCNTRTSWHHHSIYGTKRPQYCGNDCIADRIVEHWADKGEAASVSIKDGGVYIRELTMKGKTVSFEKTTLRMVIDEWRELSLG